MHAKGARRAADDADVEGAIGVSRGDVHGDVDTPRGLRPHVISRESLVVRSCVVFAGGGEDVGGGVLECSDLSEFVVGAEVRVCELASARVFDAFALELALGNLATHGPGGVGDGVVEPRGASPVELPGAKVAEAQAAREARLVGGSAAHLAQDDELRAGVEVQPEALEVVEEGVLAAARARGDAGDVSERVFRRERVVRRATRGIAERLERRANGREGARVAALIGVVRPRRRAIRRANLRGGGVAAEIQRVVVLRAAEIVHRGPRIVPIRGDATGRGGARAGGRRVGGSGHRREKKNEGRRRPRTARANVGRTGNTGGCGRDPARETSGRLPCASFARNIARRVIGGALSTRSSAPR